MFAPRLWLAAAAIVFAALWGWRELAVRAFRERVASRDAEIRRLTVENTRLGDQLTRLNFEMNVLTMQGTKVFIVVPDIEIEETGVHLHSPRLAHPEQATDFEMEVVEL